MSRFLFVTTNHFAPTGGSEVLWSRAADHLLLTNHNVGACVPDWPSMPVHLSELKEAGCELYLFPMQSAALFEKVKRFASRLFKSAGSGVFGGWLEASKPDLVIYSLGNSVEGFHLIEECINRRIPYVMLIQLVSEHNWLDDEETQKLVEIYAGAECCMFVSEGNKRLVEKMAGCTFPNSLIIQNPYAVSFEKPFDWPSDPDVYRLACVANLHALHKGHDLLFEVLRQEKWQTRSIEVDLYGEGPHRELLRRLKQMWSVKNVCFRGFSHDIESVWKDHQVLLLPSRMEGMPLALQEAMLCGRVPIVTDVGGNAELVQDGVNGFIARAPTADLLDEAMERAWARRSDWKEIGKQAYMDAHSRISPDPVQNLVDQLTVISLRT